MSNGVELSFEKAKSAYVFIRGERKKHDFEDGVLRFTLGTGEGAFVTPIFA